ncbi:MAG: (E)-4-hydroxy-3-methylbut-2-enyl-diphosphate synthase [Leptospiraceae bacterium]|nr:(E)-4-hydroxy-3-methylbut-2-enyl-diphosphate synthase [Leptospiraceae bacterium]
MNLKYCESIYAYKSWKTREVKVGGVGIGGNNPIRVQSMTTSDTRDTEATVSQIIALENVGSELVRITVPSMGDAENLPNIRNELKRLGSKVPIVADIHFTPSVALYVVDYVEKVRVNPGNFADKKKFAVLEYTDLEYQLELERISEIFLPLVKRCKELGVAMRIGTNHGSLSDRIMNRYGDTALGMVESALEFINIARSENYHDIIVSMKASNPQVMVSAYRLLVSRFMELGFDYPLHLGVTEAGDGKDGRIKSAMGIGSLLEDGLGDTIRVSLTEDSIYEIPVAKRIVEKYNKLRFANHLETKETITLAEFRDPFQTKRFYSSPVPISVLRIGENYPVRVETSFSKFDLEKFKSILEANLSSKESVKHEVFHFQITDLDQAEAIYSLKKVYKEKFPVSLDIKRISLQEISLNIDFLKNFDKLKFSESNYENFNELLELLNEFKNLTIEFSFKSSFDTISERLQLIRETNISNCIFSIENDDIIHSYRKLAFLLKDDSYPILLTCKAENLEEALYTSSIGFGSLLLDGIGDMIRIEVGESKPEEILSLSFDLLQGARLRTIKTEFISCPSCGRTLFDLQDTTARIKAKTGHLQGVKIAIMGCIVNGPGEMADADFGYVGAGPGKVHLYLGKNIVMKSIPSEIADEKLVELIKSEGKWVDKS